MNWTLSAFADEAAPSCDAQIAALQRAGLRRIDIRSIEGHNISVLPPHIAREVKQKLDDAGITTQMLGSPLGKIDIAADIEIDLQKLRHIAEIAPLLSCSAVRIFSYYNKENAPHLQWMAHSLSRLEILRDEAKKLGLVLYHENERHILVTWERMFCKLPLAQRQFQVDFRFRQLSTKWRRRVGDMAETRRAHRLFSPQRLHFRQQTCSAEWATVASEKSSWMRLRVIGVAQWHRASPDSFRRCRSYRASGTLMKPIALCLPKKVFISL
jgi:hypothetical protein